MYLTSHVKVLAELGSHEAKEDANRREAETHGSLDAGCTVVGLGCGRGG